MAVVTDILLIVGAAMALTWVIAWWLLFRMLAVLDLPAGVVD